LHQAGPNKTYIWWCMETQKSNSGAICNGYRVQKNCIGFIIIFQIL